MSNYAIKENLIVIDRHLNQCSPEKQHDILTKIIDYYTECRDKIVLPQTTDDETYAGAKEKFSEIFN
jgi:hypothetical protein